MLRREINLVLVLVTISKGLMPCKTQNVSIGILSPLRWGNSEEPIEALLVRNAASAAMAVHHVNNRVNTLVPRAADLLPAGFELSADLQDSMTNPSVAVERAVQWNQEGRQIIIGSYLSAVTGPLALVASIEATPVIVWAAQASSLSDRDTYPLLSRTAISDATQADRTLRSIRALGWTRIAILYVNDAWGRGYAQEASASARRVGVDVEAVAAFTWSNAAQLTDAVAQVAASGAHITLCAVFDMNLEMVALEAERLGVLGDGYAWILTWEHDVDAVVASSADPAGTRHRLAGWMVASVDPMFGGLSARFQSVLESEPLEHLDLAMLGEALTGESITGGVCDAYCAMLYDAVWTAAIAIAREGGVDGSVDKTALLASIRNVSFDGASGRVAFDDIGERDASTLPLIIRNIRPSNGTQGTLQMETVWRWQSGELWRESGEPPLWPGGQTSWELPFEVLQCGKGQVFSPASLQCELCPPDTVKNGNVCESYDASIGILVPLRWGGPESPMEPWAVRYAASAMMAAHHINNRNTSLVPHARELLPAGFKLVFDLQDSMATPSVAVDHVVEWNREGRHAIIGSYRSAVTGPVALAASIEGTPVIGWAASASTLSDRDTYPTLSRVAVSGAVIADETVRFIKAMGWTRVAIVYVNDAWGRGYIQDALASARTAGVDIVAAVAFGLGSTPQIEAAIGQVAESGARITICAVFDSDLAVLSETVDRYGMLAAGYAWFSLFDPGNVEDVILASAEPDKTRDRLAGWFSATVDIAYGGAEERFKRVLQREPLESLQHPTLEGSLTQDVVDGTCDQLCGTMYDAVWTAAIAIGRVAASEGSVHKGSLLAAIENVSFVGATGRVEFNEIRERVSTDVPLLVKNFPLINGSERQVQLGRVITWRWQSGELWRESGEPPLWPGGQTSWELPFEVLQCGKGQVFSPASLQCDLCPPGTEQEGNQCVRYNASIGILVPLRWGGPESAMELWAMRYAASAMMAAHHINNRNTSLVPHARELLPAGFRLVLDLQDTMALPAVAVDHTVAWNKEGRHAIIGSYRSAVTGPVALAASIEGTPVIGWGATASSLSDRDTYSTLSRTIVSDEVTVDRTVRFVKAMGWTRIAILHVNDAWGRSLSRDASASAMAVDLEIVVSAGFALGDLFQVETAVAQIAESGSRVILVAAFDSDLAAIAAVADKTGMLVSGYAWIHVGVHSVSDVISMSPDPEATREHLSGWFLSYLDLFHGDMGRQFQQVLENESVAHLNHSAFEGGLTDEVVKGTSCDQYCGTVYDAVWAAAIAISRVGTRSDGWVDKGRLLTAVSNVSFEGATGRVLLDDIGERDVSELPLIIYNIRTTGSDGEQLGEPAWCWHASGDGSSELQRCSDEPPTWPGGEQAWDLPHELLTCGAGLVFSTSSLRCEPCPPGTAKLDDACMGYNASIGVLVPLRWGGPESPMEPWAVRYAASAMMAAHHINDRNTSLVPHARELLPAGFKLVFDLQDSMATPSVAVDHVVVWNREGRHAIIGSLRSGVTGPVALAASIEGTPVIGWGATASSLSDRETYPAFSRTVISDRSGAARLISALKAVGWTRIAILHVNDVWGRGLAQDASTAAMDAQVDIVLSAGFIQGDASQIEDSVALIAESGARVILVAAFESDLTAVAAAADDIKLLSGYAWVLIGSHSIDGIIASSTNPDAARRRLAGWLLGDIDLLYGDRGDRFEQVLKAESLNQPNRSSLEGELTQTVFEGKCDQYCGTVYDAVWAAAIAISRVGTRSDGWVDKGRLLAAIRNVSFEGATGRVLLDDIGERDVSELPLIIYNIRISTNTDGEQTMLQVPTWRWQGAADGSSTLQLLSQDAPIWPGGEQAWELPFVELQCGNRYFFSPASLQCEPCPSGTVKEGNKCVRYDANVGVLVPLRWGGPESAMDPWTLRHAASAVLAAHHINNRNTTLVPHARELLPAGFKLVFEISDTMATPSVAVDQTVAWNKEGRHAIVGSLRSAVTGPVALAASIEATPVVAWAAGSSTLADRDTYPTLSRTKIRDAVTADYTVMFIKRMGWTRIAVLHVDDAWGRGFAQETSASARKHGVDIVSSPTYALGDQSEMESAVEHVAQSGVRVAICLVFDSDMAALVSLVDDHGMLASGYVWMMPFESAFSDVAAASINPEKTAALLAGLFVCTMDQLHDGRGERFRDAFESESLDVLDDEAFEGSLTEAILKERKCDQYCAIVYDAMWTAALAISQVGAASDGSVDKVALLTAVRNVSFEGATGRVQYDREIGERDASDMPLIVKNIQADGVVNGVTQLSMVPAWRFQVASDGTQVLDHEGNKAPIWPGGEQAWELPFEVLQCDDETVFSSATLRCEPCPAGTEKEWDVCTTYDARLGILVPLRWGGPDSTMEPWAVRYAASAMMAAHHINNRNTSLVPNARELLPSGFRLVFEISDTMATPSVAVDHTVAWNKEGRHAIIGSYRSAVTGPVALAASIEGTPVIGWGATATSLSDRDTYPTLSRSVVTDAVVASMAIQGIRSMGWTRIAIIHVDDEWGRGFVHEASSTARKLGVELVASAGFALGDRTAMEDAISQVSEFDARIYLCVVFDSDLAAVADVADNLGLLGLGYAWIVAKGGLSVQDVVANSPQPTKTYHQLSGWFFATVAMLDDKAGARFQKALESEGLENGVQNGFAEIPLLDIVSSGQCDQYCGTIYDAVWTAAIAISKLKLESDGSVDKAALVSALRTTSFTGATGAVAFDGSGERDASSLPLLLKNIRPYNSSEGTLQMETVWRWQSGELWRESGEPPLWPGGQTSWELPFEVLQCGKGQVFSPASLQCELCPPGTEQEGNQCINYDASVGLLIPMQWGTPDAQVEAWSVSYVASAVMAAHHINNRNTSLVPHARELLPAGFKLVFDLQDSMATPSVAVDHVVEWNREGRHAIIGSYRSAVTGPAALAASIESTPVVTYTSSATSLADRNTFPTLSRTIVSDSVFADFMLKGFRALGWSRVAVLYLDDAWGRGLSQDISSAGSRLGIAVESAVQFSSADASNIERAVHQLSSTAARVIVCLSFPPDLPTIADAAHRHGMLRKGYAWVAAIESGITEAVAASPDPSKTRSQLSGWLVAGFDALHGERGDRFRAVLEREHFAVVESELVDVNLAGAALAGVCDQNCATIYDAMWAVAIAASRLDLAADGSIDKQALLATIRNTSFEGASGWMELDEDTGERRASMPMLFKSLRPSDRRADSGGLSAVLVWQWVEDESGAGRLEQKDDSPPLWPGGDRSWTAPPDSSDCDAGFVYNNATLACLPCPPGTAHGRSGCVPCEPGRYAPEAAMIQCLPCGLLGYANESGMALCHPCPKNREMPASVLTGASEDDCVCKEGFVAGCRFHLWQVLLLTLVAVVVPAVGVFMWRLLCHPGAEDREQRQVDARITQIRAQLGLRREDGCLLSGEARTWQQTMCFTNTTQLPAKYLENLARLTLMFPFDLEAVDLLVAQLHINQDRRHSSASSDELSWGRTMSLTRWASADAIDGNHGRKEQYAALCKLLLQVSMWLLDPEEADPGDDAGSHSPKSRSRRESGSFFPEITRLRTLRSTSSFGHCSTSHANSTAQLGAPSGSASARFAFFQDRVSKLQLWTQGDNFKELKLNIQIWMDRLHEGMDQVFEQIKMEDGTQELVDFSWPEADAAGQRQSIHRQDHPSVRAIRVDDQSRLEFQLQLPGLSDSHAAGAGERGLTEGCWSPGRAPRNFSIARWSAVEDNLPSSSLDDIEPRTESTVTRDKNSDDDARKLDGSVVCSGPEEATTGPSGLAISTSIEEVLMGAALTADGAHRRPSPEPPRLQDATAALGVVAEKERRRGRRNSRRLSVSDLQSISEDGFIHQLHLRAGLLDREFQQTVRAAFSILEQDQDGGQVRVVAGPIKTQGRMREKVKSYAQELSLWVHSEQYLPLTAQILDPVRCAVVCANSRSLLQHAKRLIAHGDTCGLPVVRCKNKFAVTDASEYDGYRDLMLSVLYTGQKGLSVIGEIQLHDARMYPLKVKMHRLYKVKRATAAAAL